MFVTVGTERIMLHQIVRWAPTRDRIAGERAQTRIRIIGSIDEANAYDMTLPVEPAVLDRMVEEAARWIR